MKTYGRDLQKDYAGHHIDLDCQGTWSIQRKDIPYPLDTGILIMLKNARMVICDTCGAEYFAPGFEEGFLAAFVQGQILYSKYLPKRMIKFLRCYAGLTQEQVAKELGTDKTKISKYESVKIEDHMRQAQMVQFKLLLAGKLGITVSPTDEIWKIEILKTVQTKSRPIEFDAEQIAVGG